jgi:hypothetical protein
MKQERDICPVCGGNNLEYDDQLMENNTIGFEWTCFDCKSEGTEWFQLTFQEHVVVKEKGKLVF